MGLSYYILYVDSSYSIFLDILGWSCFSTRMSNSISKNCNPIRTLQWIQCPSTPQRTWSFRWKCLEAQQRLKCYQAWLYRAFNKKVWLRSFQEGDLVLAIRCPIIMLKHMGNKFFSKLDGSYVVQEVYTNRAYKIVNENGLRIRPINNKFFERYYAWNLI